MRTVQQRMLAAAAVALTSALAWGVGAGSASAASGTWAVDADGDWSTTTNWSGGTVADGTNFTASFTNNISATRTVDLDTDRTIGNLTFSDNGANGSAWVLGSTSGKVLNLAVSIGSPTITTTTPATISGQLSGSQGLNKTGAGRLVLTNTSNSYTGTTLIGAGDLYAIDSFGLPGNVGAACLPAAI